VAFAFFQFYGDAFLPSLLPFSISIKLFQCRLCFVGIGERNGHGEVDGDGRYEMRGVDREEAGDWCGGGLEAGH
jgi:hypothetical protein